MKRKRKENRKKATREDGVGNEEWVYAPEKTKEQITRIFKGVWNRRKFSRI